MHFKQCSTFNNASSTFTPGQCSTANTLLHHTNANAERSTSPRRLPLAALCTECVTALLNMTAEHYIAAIHRLYTVASTGPTGSIGPTSPYGSTGQTDTPRSTRSTGLTGATGPTAPCPSFLHRWTLCQTVELQGVLHIQPLFKFSGTFLHVWK